MTFQRLWILRLFENCSHFVFYCIGHYDHFQLSNAYFLTYLKMYNLFIRKDISRVCSYMTINKYTFGLAGFKILLSSRWKSVFMKHKYPWQKQIINLVILSIKVTVKVTMSLTVVSLERVSLVKYACQIWSFYLLGFKSYYEGDSFRYVSQRSLGQNF